MGGRKAYPSDLTDEQWAVVGPFLHAWKILTETQPGLFTLTPKRT